MKGLHMVSFILLIVGGLNWLLDALGWNLVEKIFGVETTITRIIYVLVGLAAIAEVLTHKRNCRHCGSSGSAMPGASM